MEKRGVGGGAGVGRMEGGRRERMWADGGESGQAEGGKDPVPLSRGLG